MKCQVIYLNRWLNCPQQVLAYHKLLQDNIQIQYAEFLYETRHYTKGERLISLQKSRELVRQRLFVINCN